jgi:LysM repeat protein
MLVRAVTLVIVSDVGLVLSGCGSQVVPAVPPAAIPASPQAASIQPPDVVAHPAAENDLRNLPRVPSASLLPISQTSAATYHRARAGETLSSIARRYGVSLGRLLEANGLDEKDAIGPDQLIYIPKGA